MCNEGGCEAEVSKASVSEQNSFLFGALQRNTSGPTK